MDYCIAVSEGNSVLYSILSKIIGVVPNGIVHSALTYYSTEDVKTFVQKMHEIKRNTGEVK